MGCITRLLIVAVLCGCFFQAGCGNNPFEMQQLNVFLQHPRAPVSGLEYRVLPPDGIVIISQHVPEINNFKQTIRPDGKINLPLLGEVMVAGHTPREIEADIKKLAKDYYAEVDATVEVTDYKSQKIFVFGMVNKAGPVPWTGRDTLLDVLAVAQPTTLSRPETIKILRGKAPTSGGYLPAANWKDKKIKKENESQGKTQLGGEVMTINLWDMAKEGDMSHNILLRPDDVVYVPPHPCVAVGQELERIMYPVRAIFGVLYVPQTLAGVVP